VRELLAGLGRLLSVQVAAGLGQGLPPRASRALLAFVVLAAGLAPVVAVLTGTIGYGDVWLWLAIEVLTIYAWTMLRILRTPRSGPLGSVAVVFFGVHYGGFALGSFAVGLSTILPWSPVRSPWLTVVVLGGLGFLALGWSVRGLVRDRVPVGVGGYVQAYVRMILAYAALFVPLVAAGRSRASTDEPLAPVSDTREAVAAVAVLLAKLALELTLVVGTERRDGQVFLLGRPLVFRLRRI
jgi:nitrate reductase NapE component